MSGLQKIADYVNENVSFPVFSCEKRRVICDSVYICGSMDKKEDWAHGIMENSRYFKLHVFCKGQDERENDVYSFETNCFPREFKLRSKKNVSDPLILAKYIVNQLKKMM